jgi:hypothetical protein
MLNGDTSEFSGDVDLKTGFRNSIIEHDLSSNDKDNKQEGNAENNAAFPLPITAIMKLRTGQHCSV